MAGQTARAAIVHLQNGLKNAMAAPLSPSLPLLPPYKVLCAIAVECSNKLFFTGDRDGRAKLLKISRHHPLLADKILGEYFGRETHQVQEGLVFVNKRGANDLASIKDSSLDSGTGECCQNFFV